jgi:predicted N-formylglutamate amidohydrolase
MKSAFRLDEEHVASLARNAVSVRLGRRNPGIVLLCEHGGKQVPEPWQRLGLSEAFFETHWAHDIGSRNLTLAIADMLDATAIISNYSRLFLDYNRKSHDPSCMRPDMGGIPVPGNLDLTEEDRLLRERIARRPVEQAVTDQLEGSEAAGRGIISIHSFTPVWDTSRRTCQIGIMWKRDARLSGPLLNSLGQRGQFAVEDNQPYSFAESDWFTLDRHGLSIDVPNAYIEVRNDLLDKPPAIETMAEALAHAIGLAITGLRKAA